MGRLRRDQDFRRVLDRGVKLRGRLLTAHVLTAQADSSVGFVAGRAVGGAILRNRARRLMREAWRQAQVARTESMQVVLVARPGITKAKMGEVAADLRATLAKLRAGVR